MVGIERAKVAIFAHLFRLVCPVLHHVVADVLRVLLLQHGQPEHQLHLKQVAVPAPRCRARVLRITAVGGRRLPATALVAWRRPAVITVQRLAADRARDIVVEPPE